MPCGISRRKLLVAKRHTRANLPPIRNASTNRPRNVSAPKLELLLPATALAVETLCDRLAIIDHGELLAVGTLPELRGMIGERDLFLLILDAGGELVLFQHLGGPGRTRLISVSVNRYAEIVLPALTLETPEDQPEPLRFVLDETGRPLETERLLFPETDEPPIDGPRIVDNSDDETIEDPGGLTAPAGA